MKKRKRTVTTIETREVVILHAGDAEAYRPRCQQCDVRMLSLDEAARVASLTPLEIYRWVGQREIHFAGTAGTILWICPASLQEVQSRSSKPPDRRELP